MKIYVFGTRGFPNIQGGVEKHCEELYTSMPSIYDITIFRRKPFINSDKTYKMIIAIPSLVLAAAIRLESEGNPFYSQIRVGQTHPDGSLSTFRMWKFRSMYKDADERLAELKEQNEIAGAMFKMRDDPRVTKIGKFIRKHSIDEFPQFLNVFLGQMSVVGPRPPLPNEVTEYTEYDLQRLSVKPGITGWWQVTDRNDTDFDGMVRRDLEYIAKRGLIMDLKIVLLTVVEVFTGGGAC